VRTLVRGRSSLNFPLQVERTTVIAKSALGAERVAVRPHFVIKLRTFCVQRGDQWFHLLIA
jgi:hypothetical protein